MTGQGSNTCSKDVYQACNTMLRMVTGSTCVTLSIHTWCSLLGGGGGAGHV